MNTLQRKFIFALPFSDYLAILLAFFAAYFLRDYINESFIIPWSSFWRIVVGLAGLWIFSFSWLGLYSVRLKRSSLEEFLKIIIGSSAAITLSTAVIYFLKAFAFSRLVLLLTWCFSILIVWFFRSLLYLGQLFFYKRGRGVLRVLLVGNKKRIQIVQQALATLNDPSRRVAGFCYRTASALRKLKQGGFDEVIVAFQNMENQNLQQLMEFCESQGIVFKLVPDIFEPSGVDVATYNWAGIPLVEIKPSTLDEWTIILKRVLDISVAGLALFFSAPIFLLTALAIKLDSPGPIFYKDLRVGKNGRRFEVLKFRSMKMLMKDGKLVHAKEDKKIEAIKARQKNYKLKNDPRITRVGKFIRRTSIDELPQFINVLRGEMSVVGPRAYRAEELELQQQRYPKTRDLVRKLLTVKPGITGIWQVSGRSEIEFSERVAMDAYYATHANLWMDFILILRTIPAVVKGSGAM